MPHLTANYTRTDMHRDFKRAMSTDEGRRVLGHLLAWCGLTSQAPPVQGTTASEAVLIHEGRRSVGLKLLLQLNGVVGKDDEKVTYGG